MHVHGSAGYSLIELLVVLAILITLSGVAVPNLLAQIDESRARGAARYLSGRLQQARMQAVLRSSDVAVRFVADELGYRYAVYVDGNGNGVLTRDIQSGADGTILWPERLSDQFSGVDFGTLPNLPGVDSGAAPGDDPVKLGTSNILTFSAHGTSSSGSLYIRGPHNAQYVVRVFGGSGKVRVLRFDAGTWTWTPLS
jgi:prepilin-type N-terminal cleavage/methylation domain-containing protein